MEPDPELLRRLDPVLHPFAAARTDLSLNSLAAVRDSLDVRRAETIAEIDATGVDIVDDDVAGVPVRFYRGAPSPSPTVIYCHAGAFMLGNLDTDHRQCVELARRGGCTVVSVDYRLAPEHPFPAALDDATTVLQWTWTAGPDLGLDRDRLVLAGNSAGAALAAGLAQRAAAGQTPPIAGALLHQPVLDDRPTASKTEFDSTPGFDGAATEAMWRHYLGATGPSAAAVPARSHQIIGAASTFITCSEVDPLRDEALDYAGRLMSAGVRTDLHVFGGTCHGFDSLCPDWEVSQTLLAMQAAALRRFFELQ
ncbi:alpha/beta hydrolase [Mycobacterium sp. SA01]|uniref:alpha/beta hydrolase n=1 Tax=Mycobacterium sp. SA01 TaxID=3238820 RepID=UPI00351B6A5F